MIKKIIKILLFLLLVFFVIIFYLSFIGIKTEKFNERILNRVSEINKKIKLDLKVVQFLLDPYSLRVNIATQNPIISLDSKKLMIKDIKTSISLRSLMDDKLSIGDLKISTKKIKLNDVILLARSFKNSTELFLLDRAIKSGFLVADIRLKFDDVGNVQNNYEIKGFIKNGKLNFLNQLTTDNLNLNFDISKKRYSLTKINSEINNVKLSSPLIEINKKKDLFLINGKILTDEKNFSRKQLSTMFTNFLKNSNIEKARFSSENDFSFNIDKKLKLKNLNIKSKIKLNHLVIKNNFIDLKSYLPNIGKVINFENHEIILNYDKKKLNIEGNGKFSIKDKFDSINYELIKENNKIKFETTVNLKNSKLLIDSLDYIKKKNSDTSVLIKGSVKNDNLINFDLISLKEKKNTISFKNLNLSKDFKIISLDSFNLNYLNSNKIKNQLFLKKNNTSYSINGESFDAAKLINKIMDSDDKETSMFDNFNTRINLKINKTYIDDVYFVNNLSGIINFKNNKIYDLDLKSFFPNDKRINISIKTNNKKEKITKLFTDYPKPLIKRYNFIKGFEEGFLVYHAIKKDGISNALLTIDNFKVKEVPVFAKLLSLASLQGIADLLTGEGIRFTDFEMKFSNKKTLTTINEMYAIGPAVSILLDGYIETKKLVSLRGTLVPATTINRSIASIPLLGKILIGDKTGEGVFGVSFKIKGAPKNLKTTVNPIKTLTPRFITRTLERIKKN